MTKLIAIIIALYRGGCTSDLDDQYTPEELEVVQNSFWRRHQKAGLVLATTGVSLVVILSPIILLGILLFGSVICAMFK